MNVVKIDLKHVKRDDVVNAANTLTQGGVLVYPTDTAYGLGVNAFSVDSIEKLYSIKGRAFTKPTHVVVKDWEMIKSICYTNSLALDIYKKYMPGAVTVILKKRRFISDQLTGHLNTLGVRIPNNLFTKKLSSLLDFPYTTPSANRSGEQAPYSFSDIKKVLDINNVDLIINAGQLAHNPPSTIVDVSSGKVQILRQGTVKVELV